MDILPINGGAVEAPMTKAQKFLRHLRKERTPLVSAAMVARVDQIAKNKRESIAFLKKGGFLDESGKLSPKYRVNSR